MRNKNESESFIFKIFVDIFLLDNLFRVMNKFVLLDRWCLWENYRKDLKGLCILLEFDEKKDKFKKLVENFNLFSKIVLNKGIFYLIRNVCNVSLVKIEILGNRCMFFFFKNFIKGEVKRIDSCGYYKNYKVY